MSWLLIYTAISSHCPSLSKHDASSPLLFNWTVAAWCHPVSPALTPSPPLPFSVKTVQHPRWEEIVSKSNKITAQMCVAKRKYKKKKSKHQINLFFFFIVWWGWYLDDFCFIFCFYFANKSFVTSAVTNKELSFCHSAFVPFFPKMSSQSWFSVDFHFSSWFIHIMILTPWVIN